MLRRGADRAAAVYVAGGAADRTTCPQEPITAPTASGFCSSIPGKAAALSVANTQSIGGRPALPLESFAIELTNFQWLTIS